MAQLLLHEAGVDTVFDLLGRHENDMTAALGWGLTRSEALMAGFLRVLGLKTGDTAEVVVRLQRHEASGGFTDIEISAGTDLHLIVEAKRGWWLPGRDQLALYGRRFQASGARQARLIVLRQWGAESAARHSIGNMALPYPCDVLGWSDVLGLVRQARRASDGAARHWLDQLGPYLHEVTDMRDTDSNRVFVVSLGHQRPQGWGYDFIEVVTKLGRYFFPADGKSWPKVPPNYIAFRYGGRLRSIHHVDTYVIVTEMSEVLPVPPSLWGPHFVLTLGPAILPPHDTPTGPRIRRAARVWVDIDLLLTSSTISEALTLTEQRRLA